MVRILIEGTHTGGSLGIPPTGKRIRLAGIVLVRISNGQLVEGWNSWDQLGMLRQIGALPGAEKQDRFLTAQS
jgi:predicted ester cyclase